MEQLKKQQKFSFYTILVLPIFLLLSCSEFFPNDGRFLVRDIDLTNKRDKAIYRLSPIKGRGLVFYIDSIGKFKMGDTIILVGTQKH